MFRSRTDKPQYACSFCGKAQEDVQRLIAGPSATYICDECISRFRQRLETGSSQVLGQPSAGSNKPQRCSFCGKGEEDVAQLIANDGNAQKGRANICNECVELCIEITDEEIDVTHHSSNSSRTRPQASPSCAFCHKDLREVRGLLPVTEDVYICNECVSVAHLIF